MMTWETGGSVQSGSCSNCIDIVCVVMLRRIVGIRRFLLDLTSVVRQWS